MGHTVYAELKGRGEKVVAERTKYRRDGTECGEHPEGMFSVTQYEAGRYVAGVNVEGFDALTAAKNYWREHIGGHYKITRTF